ncbi:MAG: RidA family protein [Parvibaculaceae bacterium]
MRRIINPPDIYSPVNSYVHAVAIDSPQTILRMSGQLGVDKSGAVPGEAVAQAELAWANIEAILAEAGMSIADITKVTSYIVGTQNIRDYVEVHKRRVGEAAPPWTLLVVAALGRPEYLIEVDVEAMR